MANFLHASVQVIILIVMLFGLFGLIIPIFPGNVVIWLAGLVYGLTAGFGPLGGWMFAVITLLMLAAVTADNILMGAGARQGGASWGAIAAGLLAGIAGTALWPPIGGLLASPLALLLAEYLRQRNWPQAYTATKGLMIGYGKAFMLRFGLGVVMIALWGVWAWVTV